MPLPDEQETIDRRASRTACKPAIASQPAVRRMSSSARMAHGDANAVEAMPSAVRLGLLALGLLMLLLGFIGALLPVMPTTIFLILAAWFFGRSSPRLETWLLEHPAFGPVLRDWREHGAIPRRAKWMACGGMTAGFALFWWGTRPELWLAVTVAVFMAACAVYVATRPEPQTGREQPRQAGR